MGFFELLLIAVVALFVVGPERLPETVRTVALTIGRLKRTLSSSRSDFERHMGVDEIRRQLRNEEIMNAVDHFKALKSQNPEQQEPPTPSTLEHISDGHTDDGLCTPSDSAKDSCITVSTLNHNNEK